MICFFYFKNQNTVQEEQIYYVHIIYDCTEIQGSNTMLIAECQG